MSVSVHLAYARAKRPSRAFSPSGPDSFPRRKNPRCSDIALLHLDRQQDREPRRTSVAIDNGRHAKGLCWHGKGLDAKSPHERVRPCTDRATHECTLAECASLHGSHGQILSPTEGPLAKRAEPRVRNSDQMVGG